MSKSIDASSRQSSLVSDSSDYRTDYTEAIAAEDKAVADIKQMARDNTGALRMLWRWGDGEGGGVLEIIAKEIGLRSPSDFPLPSIKIVKGKKVIPADLRKRVFERNAYRCVHCATHIDLCVDHIKPESKGGTLDFGNLQTLCRTCNSIKGAKE